MTEDQLIRRLVVAASAGVRSAAVLAGPGDDAAVFRGPGRSRYVITQDVQVAGRHFESSWMTGADVGWRLAAVNLSDVVAMGARASFALVSMVAPTKMPARWFVDVQRGAARHLALHGAEIVGGNVSSTPGTPSVDMTLVGRSDDGVVWRRTARAGDALVVVGRLGEAAAGLALLRENANATGRLVRAFKRPVALAGVPASLRGDRGVRGAMDVSDGLGLDVARLCRGAGVGCRVDTLSFPRSRALDRFCRSRGLDALDFVLGGGEDYAIVLAVAPRRAAAVTRKLASVLGGRTPVSVIGKFTAERKCVLVDPDGRTRALKATGWDHRIPGT